MDLYNVDIVGETNGVRFSNRYKVVADSISLAAEIASDTMKEKHNLTNVEVMRIEFVESGIIVE
jgi:hypothetical protein